MGSAGEGDSHEGPEGDSDSASNLHFVLLLDAASAPNRGTDAKIIGGPQEGGQPGASAYFTCCSLQPTSDDLLSTWLCSVEDWPT